MEFTDKQKSDMLKIDRDVSAVKLAKGFIEKMIALKGLPDDITPDAIAEVAIHGVVVEIDLVGDEKQKLKCFLLQYPEMPSGEGWNLVDVQDGMHIVCPPLDSDIGKVVIMMAEQARNS